MHWRGWRAELPRRRQPGVGSRGLAVGGLNEIPDGVPWAVGQCSGQGCTVTVCTFYPYAPLAAWHERDTINTRAAGCYVSTDEGNGKFPPMMGKCRTPWPIRSSRSYSEFRWFPHLLDEVSEEPSQLGGRCYVGRMAYVVEDMQRPG